MHHFVLRTQRRKGKCSLAHYLTYEKEKKKCHHHELTTFSSLLFVTPAQISGIKRLLIFSVIALERLTRDDIFVVKRPVAAARKHKTLT